MVVSLINCTDLSVQKDLSRMIAFFLSYSNSLIKHAQVVRELDKQGLPVSLQTGGLVSLTKMLWDYWKN